MKKVICFLVDSMRRGGKERRLFELVNAISDNYVCFLVLMDNHLEFKLPPNVEIVYLKRKKSFLGNMYSLYKILHDLKPSIIHSWYYELSVFSYPFIILNNVRFISSEITNCSPPFTSRFNLHYWTHKLTFLLAQYVTSNTVIGLRKYRVPSRKGVVIRNGFNESRLLEIDSIACNGRVESKGYTVLMIANYTDKKDHITLIKSGLKILETEQNVSFVFVGRGERQSFLEAQIPEELKHRFKFTGYVENVDPYIVEADICVLSTFSEGLSNSLLEYMAFGKPVIVTGEGGSGEVIINMENAILLDQGDVVGMSQWIMSLLEDSVFSKFLGSNAKSYVARNLTLEKMVDSFRKLYD